MGGRVHPPRFRPGRLLAWSAGFVVLLAGCGGPHPGEVEGTVTRNGQPLAGIEVSFLPDPDQGTLGPRSTGLTDAQGFYRLTCDDGRAGAVVGKHRVILHDLGSPGDAAGTLPIDAVGFPKGREGPPVVGTPHPSRVPERYQDAAGTPLREEVKEGRQTIHLEISS